MIVKAQIVGRHLRVRSKDGKFVEEYGLTSPVMARMGGADTAFFRADIELGKDGKGVLDLQDRVPDEAW